MTRVLLIADTERVQRIFQALEEKGVLQLQTVSTLELGESEMAASSYDYTFVQSRISGFSGLILLRHLDKILPEGAQLVLLGGDPEDSAQARKHGRQSLDLSMGDDLLEQTVVAVVTGAPLPEIEKGEDPEVAKASPAKTKSSVTPPAAEPPLTEPPLTEPPLTEPPLTEPPLTEPPLTEPPLTEPPLTEPPLTEPPLTEPPAFEPQASGIEVLSPFEEAMQRASSTVSPISVDHLEVQDRVEIGVGGPARENVPEDRTTDSGTGRVEEPVPLGAFMAGETLAEAMRRAEKKKSRRPYLFIVAAVLLIAVPLVSYLVGRSNRTAPQVASTPAKPPTPPVAPIPVQPKAVPQAQQPATVPVAPPAAPQVQPAAPALPPKPKPEAPAVAKPEAPQAKRGQEKLPPMLEGTKLDPDYGKSHPGWERYIGLRAEYKLFKENNLFKAMQVVAGGGGTISDDLFKRVIGQFGGMSGCRVESSSRKGAYLVEQCSATGNAALTVYRDQKSLKMKAFVVYYR